MNQGRQGRGRLGIFLLLVTTFSFILRESSGAPRVSEAAEDQRERFKSTNLKFNVPDDWPIEERGGTVGPIPVEEYLALKFGRIEGRLKEMEAKSAEGGLKLADLDSRLKVIEEWVSDIEQRLSDLEDWLKRGRARRLN